VHLHLSENVNQRINISTKNLSLVGAVLLVLDFSATSVVSAATASSYLGGEVRLPFPPWVGAAFIFVVFTGASLAGVVESAKAAFAILAFHVSISILLQGLVFNRRQILTMAILILASAVKWGTVGNEQLTQNWVGGQATSGGMVAKQLFYGFCIGMLSLTGFECSSKIQFF
jgi:hypothetical protein